MYEKCATQIGTRSWSRMLEVGGHCAWHMLSAPGLAGISSSGLLPALFYNAVWPKLCTRYIAGISSPGLLSSVMFNPSALRRLYYKDISCLMRSTPSNMPLCCMTQTMYKIHSGTRYMSIIFKMTHLRRCEHLHPS